MNELYQKYKFMEQQLIRTKASMKLKIPDIKKTLDMVQMLVDKNASDDKEVKTNFMVSDNIWAKAIIPNDTGRVGLWLGANVMVEYTYAEAQDLLRKNMKNAETRLTNTTKDVNFLKDQITTMEVNMARTYNQNVVNSGKDKPASTNA